MIFHGNNVVKNFDANLEQEKKQINFLKSCNFLTKNQNHVKKGPISN